MNRWSVQLVSSLVVLGAAGPASALEYPVLYWEAHGTVKDWATKQPIAGALVLVLLDRAPNMNFGFNPEQSDYPDLPSTDAQGRFVALAVLYREWPKTRPDQIEVIALKAGYRTERFSLSADHVSFVEDGDTRTIQLPDVELSRYQDLVGSTLLVRTADDATRLARLAVAHRHLDTSQHDVESPESVEEIARDGHAAWRVVFALRKTTNPKTAGGQLIVLVDKATGRTEIGSGE